MEWCGFKLINSKTSFGTGGGCYRRINNAHSWPHQLHTPGSVYRALRDSNVAKYGLTWVVTMCTGVQSLVGLETITSLDPNYWCVVSSQGVGSMDFWTLGLMPLSRLPTGVWDRDLVR